MIGDRSKSFVTSRKDETFQEKIYTYQDQQQKTFLLVVKMWRHRSTYPQHLRISEQRYFATVLYGRIVQVTSSANSEAVEAPFRMSAA